MQSTITKSVGNNGANEQNDVKFVQSCLNAHVKFHTASIKTLSTDGICGNKTVEAIKIFQKDYVRLSNPDGRVDPNGKTLRYLTMYMAKEPVTARIKTAQPIVASAASLAGVGNITVSYDGSITSDRRLVSEYAKDVIKIALKECNMNHAVITSTLRSPETQARIMLENAKKGLASQYEMYGAAGDSVLDVYKHNKGKSDDSIQELMTAKIHEVMRSGGVVSNHCLTVEQYKERNVFDLGLGSMRNVCKNFNQAKFTGALKELKAAGYIFKYIDETGKSNSCWHVEIKPFAKNLESYGKSSMLLPAKKINGI